MLVNAILMALREIRRNALRSFLTMLGVVIGVSAVIALVTVGRGATEQVTNDIGRLGKNLLMIRVGADRSSRGAVDAKPFEEDDVEAIRAEVPGAALVTGTASSRVLAVNGNRNFRTSLEGGESDYFEIRGYTLDTGRLFSDAEAQGAASVCVLGSAAKTELFGREDPIGSRVRLDRLSCEVIGVLKEKGQAAFGQNQDEVVILPLRTFQRRVAGTRDVSGILVSAAEDRPTETTRVQIERLLRERRNIALGGVDDFRVHDMQDIVETARGTTNVLTALLAAIAAVSLLVGGVGIMNIMLVSVTERTREIGIRLAIGARSTDVLVQFLAEAIVLSMMGGGFGVLLGLGGSFAATRALSLPFVPQVDVVGLAFVFSAVVGVAFGYLPARKAALLDPIDALRRE